MPIPVNTKADICRKFVAPTLTPSAQELRARWADAEKRSENIGVLAERGITFEEFAEQAKQPDPDPFDLLCHLAFNAPLRTRRERAQRSRQERKDFFDQHSPEAGKFWTSCLKNMRNTTMRNSSCRPCRTYLHSGPGQPGEISRLFGGPEKLCKAVNDLQNLLYV